MITSVIKCGMKYISVPKLQRLYRLRFGMDTYVISFHTLLSLWLFIHAWIKLDPCLQEGYLGNNLIYFPMFFMVVSSDLWQTHDCYSGNEITLVYIKLENRYLKTNRCRVLRFCMISGWRHQMETFSALLAICAGNLPVTGEFPSQRPVTQSFDVFFDLRLE